MAKSQVKGSKKPKKSLRPNARTEARLSYLLTIVAGGFAVTLVRNETQRHSAALKNAGQNPVSLLPLKILILHLVNRDRIRLCDMSTIDTSV